MRSNQPIHRPASFYRDRRLVVLCCVSIIIGAATPLIFGRDASQSAVSTKDADQGEPDQPVVAGELKKGTPQFETLIPEDSKIEDYGGWTRVSPPNRDPVFAYVDRIGSTPINVSQQQLPQDFKSEPDDQVKDLALGYGASKTLSVDKTTVYVGTSAKGPQSVIFRKGDLLVLIKASAAVADDAWITYIRSLR
ncbi:MAG: hypothetical protein QG649_63 [Patescibacteria group bacterium]|jgi:hypothetical protein|nr:hypothetical protein [Patescibacteria group bacterium]